MRREEERGQAGRGVRAVERQEPWEGVSRAVTPVTRPERRLAGAPEVLWRLGPVGGLEVLDCQGQSHWEE